MTALRQSVTTLFGRHEKLLVRRPVLAASEAAFLALGFQYIAFRPAGMHDAAPV